MSASKELERGGDVTPSFSTTSVRSLRKSLLRWGGENFPPYAWRSAASHWHGLIAEILLQRTKVASVIGVYARFTAAYPAPADLARASVDEIGAIIYPLGLKWRAPLLKQLGERLAERGGSVPETLPELLALPAVGPYAAAAYLSFHLNRRAVLIDANVVRWLCRMVDRPMHGETRREKWLIELADSLTPQRHAKAYNYAILDFSMQICAARPKCEECPVGPKYCAYGRKVLRV